MYNNFETYYALTSPLMDPEYLPHHARVLLRVDANVPLVNKTITDDFRLRALLPTLNVLLARKATIRLLTHIGKPTRYDPSVSTQPIADWLTARGFPVYTSQNSFNGSIHVEENVRFDPREQQPDATYAQELASNSEYYFNDAFGSAHRHDTSLTLLAQQFPHDKRGIGLLMQKELHSLGTLREQPHRPVVMVLGGGKINKLTIASELIKRYADTLLLCPLLGPAVSLAHVHSGHSDLEYLHHNKQVIVPTDYLVSEQLPWKPPFSIIPAPQLSQIHQAISIGPDTLASWKPILKQAGTIIFNGPMGKMSIPKTTSYLKELLRMIAQSKAYSVIGGGDSLHAIDTYNLTSDISYCSTGGGSMLAYLAGSMLPALEALRNK